MIRFGAVLALSLCVVSQLDASLVSSKTSARPDNLRQLMPKTGLTGAEVVPPPPQAEITSETEVVLDGKRCSYSDVPATASIAKLVLTADGRTISRIEFRTQK